MCKSKAEPKDLIGKAVEPWEGPGGWFPGFVKEYRPDEDGLFILNYYNPNKQNATASEKTEKVTRQELVGKLVYNDE